MASIDRCPGCPYSGRAIGPRGSLASHMVLVGEAPGTTEIGEPFRGKAGEILRSALVEAALDEANLFITNAVACQPHPVHPWVRAIDACRGRLEADLAANPGAVLVALGGTAVRAVTRRSGFRVLADRGTPLIGPWGTLVPTLHPARVLRHPAECRLLVEDLMLANRIATRVRK
ncbi:MAG: hypothetical protein HY263_07470 [Chloroflexi bacterium]|nr:hypothetical protein [Chloroflexota bacterium]